MAPKAWAGGAKSDVAMAEQENISDGADYRLTQDFGASVALIARSGRLPITREEKIYPTFSTPPTTFSHGPWPVFLHDHEFFSCTLTGSTDFLVHASMTQPFLQASSRLKTAVEKFF